MTEKKRLRILNKKINNPTKIIRTVFKLPLLLQQFQFGYTNEIFFELKFNMYQQSLFSSSDH